MKKTTLFLSFVFCLLSFGTSFAYTDTDVSNAQLLAEKWIIVKQDSTGSYRLDSTITRAEAIGIALKIRWTTVPDAYICKKYFIDLTINDWRCRSVELAADDGIISRVNTKARPQDSITKSEALAIVMKAGWLSTEITPSPQNESIRRTMFDTTLEWQTGLLFSALEEWVIDLGSFNNKKITLEIGTYKQYLFYPNRPATRAEVFGFVRNILSKNSNNDQQYEGFTANFDGENLHRSKDAKNSIYAFGNGWEIEGSYVQDFSLYVEPSQSVLHFDSTALIEKKDWRGNPYYASMQSWMCSTGKLVFIWQNNNIIVSGSCNQSIKEVENALRKISFWLIGKTRAMTGIDVFGTYYGVIAMGDLDYAYDMRSPSWVSREIFHSWYKNVTAVQFQENTLNNLWDNTYEFLIDMKENGVKSTYKVKSKVDFEHFKIQNISSVKQ